MKIDDTIAAIATPRGAGGIAIIRLSGSDAEKIAGRMVLPRCGGTVAELEDRKLTLCRVCLPENESFIIDEALTAVMRAPKSYTGETIVEINCHGGFLAADKILNGLLRSGARLAEAGEFTRRAFINGKTDLSGAEAVMDLMNSGTEAGLHNAALTMTGALADKIGALRAEVMQLAAHISAAADYPDEVDPPDEAELAGVLGGIGARIDGLLSGFEKGRIMRDGVRTAIVGRPNVGKSSIMNALLGCERAIVTDIPGTTRDTIEELLTVGGIALRLIDTAGIRDAADEVERIGVERSFENIRLAELCIFVADISEELTEADRSIAEALKDKKTILVLNKTDKTAAFAAEQSAKILGIKPEAVIETSVSNGAAVGVDKLEAAVSDIFVSGELKSDEVYLANERQRDSLLRARAAAARALECSENCMPLDLLFIDLEDMLEALGEVTGETVSEEIIDSVFANFCVGK